MVLSYDKYKSFEYGYMPILKSFKFLKFSLCILDHSEIIKGIWWKFYCGYTHYFYEMKDVEFDAIDLDDYLYVDGKIMIMRKSNAIYINKEYLEDFPTSDSIIRYLAVKENQWFDRALDLRYEVNPLSDDNIKIGLYIGPFIVLALALGILVISYPRGFADLMGICCAIAYTILFLLYLYIKKKKNIAKYKADHPEDEMAYWKHFPWYTKI